MVEVGLAVSSRAGGDDEPCTVVVANTIMRVLKSRFAVARSLRLGVRLTMMMMMLMLVRMTNGDDENHAGKACAHGGDELFCVYF